MTALVPKIVAIKSEPAPADVTAPTNVIPEIAFDPDIKGVCNVAGTLLISSNPNKMANIKIKIK